MPSARPVRPTDLVALVSYDGRVFPNEAITRDRLGKDASPHPLETAIEQWFSFATGRHTWISVKGATLRGLASARKRGTKAAWEIDCLICTEAGSDVMLSLLERVTEDAGRAGAEKVFLRLDADSELLSDCSAAGFVLYLRETLFVAEDPGTAEAPTLPDGYALRRWSKADVHDAFRLYNRTTPEPVRQSEAMTLREWAASRERISAGRGTRQSVAIHESGELAGTVRTAADGEVGRLDITCDVQDADLMDHLIDIACARFDEQPLLLTLVPSFAVALASRLEERGFRAQGECVVLVRRTTRRVAALEPAPAAVPVQIFPA